VPERGAKPRAERAWQAAEGGGTASGFGALRKGLRATFRHPLAAGRSLRRPPRTTNGTLPDPFQLAHQVFQEAIGEAPPRPDPDGGKNPAAVALGKLGGAKGGKARAARLSPEERRESARKACTGALEEALRVA
jgi:hypothetical protein